MKTPVFEVYQDHKKAWRWRLVAGNGRIIAQGESHPNKANAERAVATVVRCALFARQKEG
jgi:uncharacterized protein YegP (UPF0339 family)